MWVMANDAVEAPPAILTDAGIVASFVFELERVTVAPAGSADPLRVTVPDAVVCEPPTTLAGAIANDRRDEG